MTKDRKPISPEVRKLVFAKTGGRCHMCGKLLIFNAKEGSRGRWHVDHILQKANDGECKIENYLAVCRDCNWLRRNYKSKTLRRIFRLGILAYGLTKNDKRVGSIIKKKYNKRRQKNFALRKK